MKAMTHAHHYICESPDGVTPLVRARGVCKHCGAERYFATSDDEEGKQWKELKRNSGPKVRSLTAAQRRGHTLVTAGHHPCPNEGCEAACSNPGALVIHQRWCKFRSEVVA